MSYLSSNPYLLNIVPLFNVANSGEGGATDTALTNAVTAITQIQQMVQYSNATILTDVIGPLTSGGNIAMVGDFAVEGSLKVNGVEINGSTITTSISSLTAGSNSVSLYENGLDTLIAGNNTFSIANNGDITTSGNLFVNQDITCQTLFQLSDDRYKKNKVPLTGALSTLCEIRGVRYELEGKDRIGFIAQELIHIVPEAVNTANSDQWTVDYSQIVPLLVEALKEIITKYPLPSS